MYQHILLNHIFIFDTILVSLTYIPLSTCVLLRRCSDLFIVSHQ